MKKLSIGIQTFSKLIKENYIYVDKTDIIHQLISRGSAYFLSRPRRFGKSLLVSTLAEIFRGNKELFSGLAIDSLPYDWEQHPVVLISFSDISYTTPTILENGIKLYLQRRAQEDNITLNQELNPAESLQELIVQLAKKNPVALLIDEYDYAILQHIHNQEMADTIRETLKKFYTVIKGLDPYLKFVLLTGVSKFPRTSIFSGLNNLNDISLDAKYNNLLGYTKSEITGYFPDYLASTAQQNDYDINTLLHNIELWYDGYKFCSASSATKLYNPFSVLLLFSKERFANYWFETGTPTFLINLIKHHNYPMQDFEATQASELELGMFDVHTIPLKTLLYQTGYLTIREYDTFTHNYILGYPNKETINSLSLLGLASQSSNKKTSLTGIAFDTTTKNVSEVVYKQIEAN
ncbi:MAG TPA: AAA family ATPase [Candidatus Babeliales bacterium]|nr:AAA family ATPase [Candidatus Babeliales bacterium]